MTLRPDIKAKLDSLGLPEAAIDNIPDRIPGGWRLRQFTNGDGYPTVTYGRSDSHPFEVEFVGETPQDARAMMRAWLKEHRGL